MIEVSGKFNKAKIFTDKADQGAIDQIIELCNQEFIKGSKIRVMPDYHVGMGCTIGTTMTITDKVVANLVGVDIGCGMEVAMLDKSKNEINYDRLDETIRKHIPHGFKIRNHANHHPLSKQINFDDIRAPFDLKRARASVGTLGGGNHFIELNELGEKLVLVIHSGSRHLGKQIAEHYQKRAYEELIEHKPQINKQLAYLEGQGFKDYMNDMKIAQYYANLNRKAMLDEIITRMGWKVIDGFTTIHNYIDMDSMI